MTPERWLQVKEIFHEAAELASAERASFLKARCAGDDEMLRELQLLMESLGESEDFIEQPALASASELLSTAREDFWAGRTIGQYRVEREIGRGGMGLVLLAVRADDQFQKQVAIKLLQRGMGSDLLLRRFQNERQILASLEHPNIAHLLDGGITEDGLPYFVMEYIEGLPLNKYCDQHALSIRERLELFRTVCAAIEHAHRNLIVHRDLKPSNILVTADGVPKLLDFGIAKLLDERSTSQPAELTATILRALTPEYASPEQVRGRHISTASDIYSLGVILYELLTGARPLKLKDTSPEEMLRIICATEPTKPSQVISDSGLPVAEVKTGDFQNSQSAVRSPKALRGDLDNIVLMALRKDPARRYQSVEQFSEDIRRHLHGLPVLARKDTFSYLASKFIKRNKVSVAAAALVLLTIIGGLMATIWQARVAARERDQARQEQAKAEQLNKFLQSILSAASPEEKGRDAKVIEVLKDAAQRIQTELADQPALKAQALETIGETYVRLGLMDEAESSLREALQINSSLYGVDSHVALESASYLAIALMNKGKGAEADPLLTRAIEAERQRSPAGSKELAFALDVLGELDVRRGEYEKAQPLLRESVALYDKISGPVNEDSAFALISLGRTQGFSGDVSGAEETYRKSIAIYRQLPARYASRMATALLNLGLLLTKKGDFDEGIKTLREGDAILTQQGESFLLFASKAYLCAAYANHGDDGQALAEGAKAIDLGRQMNLEDTREFIFSLDNVGLSLTRTGHAGEAEPLLRESFDRAKKDLPSADVRTPLIEENLGVCLTALGKFDEAAPFLSHSYETLKARDGEKNSLTTAAVKHLVELYEKWKRPDLATKYRALLPQS